MSQSKISSRLDIGAAVIGKTLARLERKGYITRKRYADDRRRVMVRLIDKGAAIHGEFHATSKLIVEDIQKALGEAEYQRISGLCDS